MDEHGNKAKEMGNEILSGIQVKFLIKLFEKNLFFSECATEFSFGFMHGSSKNAERNWFKKSKF